MFRQHGYTATTLGGRDYANVYGFLFRFDDDGLIDRVWEHWGTLAAYEQLFQSDLVVDDPDVMLMTTPSVRLRLDLERPVPRDVIEQCLDVAVHAPNGSNTQPYKFLCIDDDDRKLAIADLYRTAMQEFMDRPRTAAPEDNVDRTTERQQRIARSVFHLRDHLHEVPVLCVPIVAGRTDGLGTGAQAERTSVFWQSSRWGSVIPTLWSFMLALRSRGLGSAWTTLTLFKEREMAELLGIPFDEWMQVGLFPIVYTQGTDFAVTPREPARELPPLERLPLVDPRRVAADHESHLVGRNVVEVRVDHLLRLRPRAGAVVKSRPRQAAPGERCARTEPSRAPRGRRSCGTSAPGADRAREHPAELDPGVVGHRGAGAHGRDRDLVVQLEHARRTFEHDASRASYTCTAYGGSIVRPPASTSTRYSASAPGPSPTT